HQLSLFEGVDQCAVLLQHQSENGHQHLCAYYVSSDVISATTLRSFLKERLPDYMLPSYFIRINALPVTVNGKLDRKRLPLPEYTPASLHEQPVTANEQLLVQVWMEVLGHTRISVCDNFFLIGGDSIKSIQ